MNIKFKHQIIYADSNFEVTIRMQRTTKDRLKYYFENESKTLLWTIGSFLPFIYIYNESNNEVISRCVFIFWTLSVLATFIHISMISIKAECLPKCNRYIYSFNIIFNMMIPVIFFAEKPILSLVFLLLYSILFSIINSIVTGIHQSVEYNAKTIITSPCSFEKIVSFQSDFSLNNPDKGMAARQSFFKTSLIAMLLIVVSSCTIYSNQAFNLSFEHIVIALDSSNAVSIVTAKFDDTKNNYSSHAKDDIKTIEKNSKSNEDEGISIIDKMNSKFPVTLKNVVSAPQAYRSPEQTFNLNNRMPSSYAEQFANFFKIEDTNISPVLKTQEKQLDYGFKYINYFVFKVLISIITISLIAYYWNIKNFSDDYNDKWKVLNEQLLNILQYKNDNQDKHAMQLLKIKFCIDALDMKMWGHKTFSRFFTQVIHENKLDGTTNHKELLEKLHVLISLKTAS